jgi:cytoskeleton protein RodZ
MPSAGELLRSERLKKNRSLAEIASQTRISRRYLEAIETDSTADLPGEFFYKSFIRQYANALELDSATTERILSSAVPLNEPDPVPVLSQVYERQREETTRWQPSTGVAVGALVAVIAGGALLYAVWQRLQTPVETAAVTQSPSPQNAQAAPVQAETPPPTAAPAEPPQTPAAEPAGAPAAQTQAPSDPASVAGSVGAGIELAASEPAWVQVSSDGKTLFIGTLKPNEPKQLATGSTVTLRTGNAGALDVRWNGKSVGPLGPKGHIRVVRFTPEGVAVVPPRPKPVPAEPGQQP